MRDEHIVLDLLASGVEPLSGTLEAVERRVIERMLAEVEGNRDVSRPSAMPPVIHSAQEVSIILPVA